MRIHRFAFVRVAWAACLLALLGCQSQSDPVLQQGYEALNQKQFDLALSAADAYLRQSPDGAGVAQARYLRGRALEQREKATPQQVRDDLQAARAAYRQALGSKPATVLEGYILTSLANCDYFLQDYPAAEEHWLAAADRLQGPKYEDLRSWVLYRAGLCRQRVGRFAAADQLFEMVMQHYPGTEAAARAFEHHGIRQFFVQVGAFQSPSSADALIGELRGRGYNVARVSRRDKPNLLLVMAGPVPDYVRASNLRTRLLADGYKEAMIVP